MKQTAFILIAILILLSGKRICGNAIDSTNNITSSIKNETLSTNSNADTYEETNDFSPMVFFIFVCGIAFVFACIGGGIVLTVLGLFIVFELVSFGIISTAIIVGINKQSLKKGFKTFILIASTIGGLLIGGMSFWLLNKVTHWWTTQTAILTGLTSGFIGGLGLSLIAFYILQRLTIYFKQKLDLTIP